MQQARARVLPEPAVPDSQADLRRALRALELAQRAGSPVAQPDTDVAERTLRRLHSVHRRRWNDRTPRREAIVEDLAHGYADWAGGKKEVGSLMIDFRWLASVVLDTVYFMPPAGSSGFATDDVNDERTTQLGRTRLFDAARSVGLKLTNENDGRYNRSFTSYRIDGRGPLWVLMHRAAPIFAFTNAPPGGYPLEPAGAIIDPPFDIGTVISADWRLLNADQAACQLTQGRVVDLLDRDFTDPPGVPQTVQHVLFTAQS